MNLFAQNVYIAPNTPSTTQATNSGIATILIIVYLALLLIMIVSLMKIFSKAGRKWWEAIIPIYNAYVILRIVGRPGWWLLLYFIPIVNVVVSIIVIFDLAKVFGKGAGTALGLFFLSFIFLPLMAFSDSYKYKSIAGGATPAQAPKQAVTSQPATTPNVASASEQSTANIPAAGAAVGVGVGAAQENEPITNAPLDQQSAENSSPAIGEPPTNPTSQINPAPVNPDVVPAETVTTPPASNTDAGQISPESPVEPPQTTDPATPPSDVQTPAPTPTDDQQNPL